MKLKIVVLVLLYFVSVMLKAQTKGELDTEFPKISNTPIPIEVFANKDRVSFQLLISKHFSPNSRLGFFNVTQFTGRYSTADQAENELMSLPLVTFDVWKGFSLNAGTFIDNYTGFSPTAGVQYLFAKQDFLLIALPRVDLVRNYNFEAFGLVEFTPKYSANWGFYTRLQGMYNHNIKQNLMERSYFNVRGGMTYKNLQFGLGYNYDVYGGTLPNKHHSLGIFVRTELF